MEKFLTASNEALSNFENQMQSRIKSFHSVQEQFKDYKDDAKNKAIQETRKQILTSTLSFLDKKKPEVYSDLKLVDSEISKTVYPMRSSTIPAEVQAGESMFQSALALVNSKNKDLILNELRKANATDKNDFVFSVYEIMRTQEHDAKFMDQLFDIVESSKSASAFSHLLGAQKNYNEILNQINFYTNQAASGMLPTSYKTNKSFRDEVARTRLLKKAQ